MNANEIAKTLYPEMPIPTELIAKLLTAAEEEPLATVLIAAYKLGYQQGQEN